MKKKTRRRGILLFSGGIDSTLSALILHAQGVELIALTINYPGRPEGEIRATEAIEKELPFLMSVDVKLDTGGPLTKFPSSQNVDQGWVPYRNLLFWAIAAHKAMMLDADFVAAGHDDDDGVAFSDASEEFFAGLGKLLKLTGSTRSKQAVVIELPIYTASLEYLQTISARHAEIMEMTWSCWLDETHPCMSCYACKEREDFFRGLK
jgi:7-cyano-7-deazaguanine synthase